MLEKKKDYISDRNPSIDLLRIVAMFMVLVLHINLLGGFLQTDGSSLYTLAIKFYEHISIIAVDTFIIISSWFLCQRNARPSKVVVLISNIIFWTFLTNIVAYILGISISVTDILQEIPIIGRSYDFMSGYILLYLLSPYLNHMVMGGVSSRQHCRLAVSAFLLLSVLKPAITSHYLKIAGDGYNLIWFIGIYIITSYIRRSNFSLKKNRCLWIYLLLSLIGTVADYYNRNLIGGLAYNNPIVAVAAMSFFLYFKEQKIESHRSVAIISTFAPYAFAVYLIHSNMVLSRYISSLHFCDYIPKSVFVYIIAIPLLASCIYLICTLLEILRIRIFKILQIDAAIRSIVKKIDNF